MKLSDTVVRDPFKSPVQVDVTTGSRFQRAVQRLLGERTCEKVLVSSPASWPLNVIGSTVLEKGCMACDSAIWVAPSSAAVVGRADVCVVCLECLSAALKAEAP